MSVAIYAEKFSRLAVNVAHGRASPHKICMLLAVLDLARGGGLTENGIRYEPMLLERYRRFFEAVRAPGEKLDAGRLVRIGRKTRKVHDRLFFSSCAAWQWGLQFG